MSVSPQSETGLKQEDEVHGLTIEPTNRIIQEDPQHSGGAKELKKVRTGCLTCKLRKVKCDETKPVCLRCAQGGRPCQGYPAIPPRAKRSKQKRSSNWSLALKLAPRGDGGAGDPSASDLSPDMLSPGFITSPTSDKSALVIFRCRTAPRLSTFMDKHFWTELVLQMGDEEPAVLHALTALNFVYDFYEADGMNNLMPMKSRLKSPTYTKGLRAFNQGISELLERPSQLQHDNESVHLVCCIIFVCIEMLCTEHWAAMVHFDRGTKLLETLMLDQTGETGASLGHRKIVREVLLPMFRRLNIHASILGKNNAIFDSFPPLLQADGSGVSYPYKDLTSSTDALFTLLDAGLRQVNLLIGFNQLEFGILEGLSGHPDLLDQVLEHQRRSMAGFAEWLAGFSPLSTAIAVSPSADPQEKLCCWTLRAYHMVSEIWGMEVLARSECAYDKHLDRFATVVHIASNSLQLQKAVGEKQAMPVFSFELGMLTPLYFTLWRCRQRRVRKAAWTLMRDWPKKENFWCPQLAALAGKLLLTTEDPSAFEPGNETVDYWPPEEDRLHKATITHEFHDDEPTTVHMTLHRKPQGLNGEWEIIRRSAIMES